jgi:YD repeat-containing protein
MPTIIPASPTAAALMKFEEVPVDNYTGIPDISIPLVSVPTHSKDVGINLALKYHPLGTGYGEVAGEAGLGWSMITGGSITRTVRGLPDEQLELGYKKIGMYRYNNPYNHIINNDLGPNSHTENEFLWETQEHGKYDTEHDLWQFNFMGHTGRFIIKNIDADEGGELAVFSLDKTNTLKIILDYDYVINPPALPKYVFNGFTVFDDKGYKFVFTAKEETTVSNFVYSEYYCRILPSPYSANTTSTTYTSGFQLTEVFDNNGNQLIEFLYNTDPMKECKIDHNTTRFEMISHTPLDIMQILVGLSDINMQNQQLKMGPTSTGTTSTRVTKTKKVQTINVADIARIYVNYASDRLDLEDGHNQWRINEIVLDNWDNIHIKKIDLFPGYSSYTNAANESVNRLMLDSVTETRYKNGQPGSQTLTTRLEYSNPPDYGLDVFHDAWGNFMLREPKCNSGVTLIPYIKKDILQKMTLPTGGCIIYDFEPNTYSYIGDEPVTNFDENPDNWIMHDVDANLTGFGNFSTTNFTNAVQLFTLDMAQTIKLDYTVDVPTTSVTVKIYKLETNGSLTEVGQLFCQSFEGFCEDMSNSVNFPSAGTYYAKLFTTDGNFDPPFTVNIKACYATVPEILSQHLFGGGVRIKRIGAFEQEVDKNVYENPESQATKEKKYNYNFFGTAKSSGSLAYARPVFDYNFSRNVHFEIYCSCGQCQGNVFICENLEFTFEYTAHTANNNLQQIRTKGADVGYRNVTVSETGNGRAEFSYLSPIDHPEDNYYFTYPFCPSPNLDYKRGLVTKEEVFNEANQKLKKIDYGYDIVDEPEENTITGLRTKYQSVGNNPFTYKFAMYTGIIDDALDNCSGYGTPVYTYPCGYLWDTGGWPNTYIGYDVVKEATGWAKLVSKTTTDYFYNPNRAVAIDETFNYNPANKQISEHTATGSNGEVLKTEYFYHTGNSTVSQNRVSEIEQIRSFNNSTLISGSKINYGNNFTAHHSWLPEIIRTAPGSQPFEDKIIFRQYDAFGNPEIVEEVGGNKVYYVWGYKNTQPILKVESATDLSLPSIIVNQIKGFAEANDMVHFLDEVAQLRSALPGAMVTAYTYVPLIGVQSVTDAKGMTTTYEYDELGRVELIRDNDGNLISENKYNYRTQN